jgi:Dyp-type peroxidase family
LQVLSETTDIQAIIVTGFGYLPWSRYLFLHADESGSAQAWLADVAPTITHSSWRKGPDGRTVKPHSAVNIAISCQGLVALGLNSAAIQTFPEELVQGMGMKARARRLGDNGASDPSQWELGNPGVPPNQVTHFLLILQTATEPELDRLEKECQTKNDLYRLRNVVPPETGRPLPLQKEHFGFHDSISQPEIEETPKSVNPGAEYLKTGEFILGYENEYGLFPATPMVSADLDVYRNLVDIGAKSGTGMQSMKDLGRNGSYLVFRKLEQDVAAFRRFIIENADKDNPDLLGAKMVGRWPSGTPLVKAPSHDDAAPVDPRTNDFDYTTTDTFGYSCPLGAHIRRANPRDAMADRFPGDSIRDSRRHRILRRGTPYGNPLPPGAPDDGGNRGLLFICVNADIKRQFEFVQQTWINNPKFHGLTNDRDPIIGDNLEPTEVGPTELRTFTIQRDGDRTRIKNIPRFVKMKGGGYFFIPSIRTIYFLAAKPPEHSVL